MLSVFPRRRAERRSRASIRAARLGTNFEVRGRDIYLRLPSGVARTKLTNAWFDSKLRVTSTLRNWRTVLKLGELARTNERASDTHKETKQEHHAALRKAAGGVRSGLNPSLFFDIACSAPHT